MPGFSSSYSPLFLLAFLFISAAVSYWFYRNSALGNAKRYVLMILKTLGLFLLLALFVEPVLSLLAGTDDEALDIVLVDNSRSNELFGKNDELKRILTANSFTGNKPVVLTFSNRVKPLNSVDSLHAEGFETTLSGALRELKAAYPDRMFNSITVLSDGIFNAGGNPLYEAKTFRAPFFTYALGDTVQQNDILIRSVSYNEKAFTNQPAIIRAYVNSYFAEGRNITVNLFREGSLIAAKSVDFPGKPNSQEVEFSITESTPGKIRYRIETAFIEGELTKKNNSSDFFITYTDNKINLLVISGGPGYDNEFTGSVLKRIGNYNITYRTAKTPSEFYEGGIDERMIAELSAVFFLNYPTSQTSSATVSDIVSKIKQHNIPLVFFAGKNTDYQKTSSFEDLLPFSITRPNSGETQFSLQTVTSNDNPLSKISGVNSSAQIFRNVSGIQPKPGSVVLATDKASGEPVMVSRQYGNSRSTAFLGYGLWRWKLNPGGDNSKSLESFIPETVNMTLQKEKKTRFRVYPAKDVFDYSEEPLIYAEVYDENYVPTRNASVNGIIKDKNGSKVAELKFESFENKFISKSGQLSTGEYTIDASCEYSGVYLGSESNRFLADSLNTEFTETKTDAAVLRELSDNTGGKVIGTEESEEILNIIKSTKNPVLSETTREKQVRFNLWENKYLLILIILLFTAEWILRKRNNLA